MVYNAETGEYICDISEHDQEYILLKGGRGGLGNFNFATPTNQAPRYAQPGEPMQELTVILELKMLADVGLVGFPNAGKSTLVNTLSSAKPKIGNYPFTTLEPSVGVVPYRDNRSFVIADIPGIIEGASEGRGLGLRFLRHIERNSLLLFMVAADSDDLRKEYDTLLNELKQYNPELLEKQRVLAITKCDIIGEDKELIEMLSENLPTDIPVVFISSVSGYHIQELKDLLWKEMNEESNKIAATTSTENILKTPKDLTRFSYTYEDEDDKGWDDEFFKEEEEEFEMLDEDDIEDLDEDAFEYVDTSDDN